MSDDLFAQFQEAAFEPGLWARALSSLSESVEGAGAALISTNKHLTLSFSPELERPLETYHAAHWNVRDERSRGIPTMLRRGVTTEADFIDLEEMKRSPYYRDFLEPFNLRWFAGLGFSVGGQFYCISVQRRIDQGPFEKPELEALKRTLVPLHDAITISQKFGQVRVAGMLDSLELLAQPALICDDRGRVIALNGTAESVFSAWLDPHSRRLRLGDSQSQANLDRLLKTVISRDRRRPCDTVATIRGTDGRWRPIRAVALERWASPFMENACALLLMPQNTSRAPDRMAIRQSLGLTNAEAALARALSEGHGVRDAANELGISYETARSYLKTIFGKTGVHRQSELVALLRNIEPRPISPGAPAPSDSPN